jgi:hypothetical protein
MKNILQILLITILMSGCGLMKKASSSRMVKVQMDSVAVQKVVVTNVVKVSGDSVVCVDAVEVVNTFLVNPNDTAVTYDSLATEEMELYITATPGVVKDGVMIPQKIRVKAKRKAYVFVPNYNYENISTMTMSDSTVKNINTIVQSKTVTKTRDNRMTAWAVIVLCISVFAGGWCVYKISKTFKNNIK